MNNINVRDARELDKQMERVAKLVKENKREFKVGDKVKVISENSRTTETSRWNVGHVGIVTENDKVYKQVKLDNKFGGWVDYRDIVHVDTEHAEEKTETIVVEDYKKAINNLMEENRELQAQLEYADEQLEQQANIIDKLEDYAHELHDKLIEKMKGE